VSVREEVRRALEEIASQKGFSSLNDVIAFLLDKYKELTDISVRCDNLLTDISAKLDRLLQARVATTGSVTASTGSDAVNTGNVAGTGKSYKWCRPRSSIKDLESFVRRVERTLGLEDWWEDDDRVCFKTRRMPTKT
jgi:hypothetical protein